MGYEAVIWTENSGSDNNYYESNSDCTVIEQSSFKDSVWGIVEIDSGFEISIHESGDSIHLWFYKRTV